jgi:hypothetical protein
MSSIQVILFFNGFDVNDQSAFREIPAYAIISLNQYLEFGRYERNIHYLTDQTKNMIIHDDSC